ncbi:YcdB/YcdC domain-containing protein [Ureibacillus sp. GCM10028918]|uniref:YcdB/YcdC domain-containing protein n=1 Tax=Ureibacillus sp. GCM10028918 TaxID=3273429 RepID=UPI00361CF224
MDSFLQRHNKDTVKAFISKKTGRIRRFVWFKERSGDLCLNREQCYQKAIDFLQMSIPNYDQYLQLLVQNHDNGELDEPGMTEAFTFQVHNWQGIRVPLELVIVTVNRQTGLIDYYSGPSFDFEQLKAIPSEPVISQKEAHNIFLKSLDFELARNIIYEENEEVYVLAYETCDREKRKAIRYIDAMTGAVITEKE